jgi:hypothetical protein
MDLVRFVMHVDGFSYTTNILRPGSIEKMTTPSSVHPHYARGWGIIGGNWWHNGALPGTTALVVRTHNGFCVAALGNRITGTATAAWIRWSATWSAR